MATFSVAGKLRAKYDDYYDGTITEWRRLGAIGKADNIVALCREHPHATVLEVGFGDGAILRRLEGLGFGEAMHGLEISSSGLEAMLGRKHIFREEEGVGSSTLDAVRYAYDLLAGDLCRTCPRRDEGNGKEPLYYMI